MIRRSKAKINKTKQTLSVWVEHCVSFEVHRKSQNYNFHRNDTKTRQ